MKKAKKTALLVMACGLSLVAISPMVFSHCEIPCGIYDDPMRLNSSRRSAEPQPDMLAEHITTIDVEGPRISRILQIYPCNLWFQALSAQSDKNYNQLVRWIVNKENHADYFSDIVTQYFMTQRLKPSEESDQKAYPAAAWRFAETSKEYVHKLTLLHKMMVYAMRCKQTTGLENVEKLRAYLSEFRAAYLGTGS